MLVFIYCPPPFAKAGDYSIRLSVIPSFRISFPDDNLSMPCPIETKLIEMEGIGKGKITIDFWVSRSKVKVTISKNRIYCAKIWSMWEFFFYPISMGFFSIGFLSKNAFIHIPSDFCYLLPFSR